MGPDKPVHLATHRPSQPDLIKLLPGGGGLCNSYDSGSMAIAKHCCVAATGCERADGTKPHGASRHGPHCFCVNSTQGKDTANPCARIPPADAAQRRAIRVRPGRKQRRHEHHRRTRPLRPQHFQPVMGRAGDQPRHSATPVSPPEMQPHPRQRGRSHHHHKPARPACPRHVLCQRSPPRDSIMAEHHPAPGRQRTHRRHHVRHARRIRK